MMSKGTKTRKPHAAANPRPIRMLSTVSTIPRPSFHSMVTQEGPRLLPGRLQLIPIGSLRRPGEGEETDRHVGLPGLDPQHLQLPPPRFEAPLGGSTPGSHLGVEFGGLLFPA